MNEPRLPQDPIDVYREIAREQMRHSVSVQADYGKWILASLLAVNAGGLIAISQAGEHAAALFKASGTCLFVGTLAALVAGGLTWINFTVAALTYLQIVQDRGNSSIKKSSIFVQGSAFLAVVATVISVLAFAFAGYRMLLSVPM